MTDQPDAQSLAGDQPRDLFDRRRRALRRARSGAPRGQWFDEQMAAMLIERLDDLTRTFSDVLLIGGRYPAMIDELAANRATAGARVTVMEASAALAARSTGTTLTGEEDRLPVEPESYDCILWPGGLESVNDVPGALLRCRMALRPDGLLLGCFPGDGSLAVLRSVMRAADGERAIARMQPQIDARAMSDLMTRTGLKLTVVDSEAINLSYGAFDDLIADLREAALTSMLAGPVHPVSRAGLARARQAFADAAGPDNRTLEQLRIVHFSGWAPHPDQPKPAQRGSATASLAAALKPGQAG